MHFFIPTGYKWGIFGVMVIVSIKILDSHLHEVVIFLMGRGWFWTAVKVFSDWVISWMQESLEVQDLIIISGHHSMCKLGTFLSKINPHLIPDSIKCWRRWWLSQILHIAYSRYRAIPAFDIDIRDVSAGTLTSSPAASHVAWHTCNTIALSISQRTACTAWISDIATQKANVF